MLTIRVRSELACEQSKCVQCGKLCTIKASQYKRTLLETATTTTTITTTTIIVAASFTITTITIITSNITTFTRIRFHFHITTWERESWDSRGTLQPDRCQVLL